MIVGNVFDSDLITHYLMVKGVMRLVNIIRLINCEK